MLYRREGLHKSWFSEALLSYLAGFLPLQGGPQHTACPLLEWRSLNKPARSDKNRVRIEAGLEQGEKKEEGSKGWFGGTTRARRFHSDVVLTERL